jgi:hypothetical protein
MMMMMMMMIMMMMIIIIIIITIIIIMSLPQTVGSNPDVCVKNDAKYRMASLLFQHMKRKFV